jgi:hypothetical protein
MNFTGDKSKSRQYLEEAHNVFIGFADKDNNLVIKTNENLQLLTRIS